MYIFKEHFETVISLKENNCIDGNDLDAINFDQFLNSLADGKVTLAQWELIRDRCSRDTIGDEEWKRCGFNSKNTTYLLPTNHEVLVWNNQMLIENGGTILKVSAVNSCALAKKQSSDTFHGLMNVSYLSVGALVIIQVNLKPEVGLCNGSQGRICDFKFDKNNFSPEDISISSSICVWVEFDDYSGKTFFSNDESKKHWVPIFLVQKDISVVSRSDGFKLLSQTMIPLRLSWEITIHKAQGQTISSNIVVCLDDREITLSLSYVAFSCVTKLQSIGIDGGVPADRLMKKISSLPSLKK